jgi:hypothetical protein
MTVMLTTQYKEKEELYVWKGRQRQSVLSNG